MYFSMEHVAANSVVRDSFINYLHQNLAYATENWEAGIRNATGTIQYLGEFTNTAFDGLKTHEMD